MSIISDRGLRKRHAYDIHNFAQSMNPLLIQIEIQSSSKGTFAILIAKAIAVQDVHSLKQRLTICFDTHRCRCRPHLLVKRKQNPLLKVEL